MPTTPETMLDACDPEERTGDVDNPILYILARELSSAAKRRILSTAREERLLAARSSSPTHGHYVHKLEIEVALRHLLLPKGA